MAEQEDAAPAAAEEEPQEEYQEEAPKEEEPAAQEEEAAPAEEEPAAEEPAAEEEPKEEEAAPAEEPAAEEPPAEEPKAEEPPKEEPKEEAPKEEEKEEPKPKKKKGKKKKKKGGGGGGGGDNEAAAALWKQISAKKATDMNYYICALDGKVGKTTTLKEVKTGTGGAKEIIEFLQDKNKEMMFGLLKAVTTDDAMSVRLKFIYFRFIGSGVGTMTKAKLTGSVGKIDDAFPCKHLTLDIDEKCVGDLSPEALSKELLRVGGAHKPDKISFGPDQDIDVTSYKNN